MNDLPASPTPACTRRTGAGDTACRCSAECRDLHSAARKARAARTAAGRPGRVPATVVATHIKVLLRAHTNATLSDLAITAGVSRRALDVLMADVEAGHDRKVNVTTARKVLAVRTLASPERVVVDATGTRRRVEALMTLGWAAAALSRMVGLSPTALAPSSLDTGCYASTAQAVAQVYERLRWSTGPSTRSANRARRSGFAPPMAWNRNIDNPTATPDVADLADPAWRAAIARRYTPVPKRQSAAA